MAQLVIRDAVVLRHRQDWLGGIFHHIRLRCLQRKQFLIPLIQSQQMFKHRQTFGAEDGIWQCFIKQLYMALGDLRDVKRSVIQIDGIAYAISRLCWYLFLLGRGKCCHLLLSLLIREITIDAEILPFLLIVHSSAVILEAVSLHCTVHIALGCFFCLGQRLIIQFFIKAVF